MSVRVFTAFVCVCDLACLCVCVFLLVRASVSLYLCVGLFHGGFRTVERPCAVHVRAGSQHPVLQEEVPGVGQVCGAALSPRCKCLLFTHGAATSATLEQLTHRCVCTECSVIIFYFVHLRPG